MAPSVAERQGQGSLIHNCQNLEAAEMALLHMMDKQTVLHGDLGHFFRSNNKQMSITATRRLERTEKHLFPGDKPEGEAQYLAPTPPHVENARPRAQETNVRQLEAWGR